MDLAIVLNMSSAHNPLDGYSHVGRCGERRKEAGTELYMYNVWKIPGRNVASYTGYGWATLLKLIGRTLTV